MSTNMRTRFPIALAAFVAMTAASAAQAKPDFSGVWIMDATKSDFGGMPSPETMTRTITHKEPSFRVVTVQKGGTTEDRTIDTAFTTDGKAQTNTIPGGSLTLAGKWEGTTLVLAGTMSLTNMAIPVEDRFVLSQDGTTLTVTRKFSATEGSFSVKVVMTKKP
jgi:hypothetical protein